MQLTPGTATFVCGSCLRDQMMVRRLRELGHDAHVAPLYLPHAGEGTSEQAMDSVIASDAAPLFFGGINVYLQQRFALFRHTPRWLDRWLDRPGLLRWVAGRSRMTAASEHGAMTVSMLRGEHGRQRKELDRLVAWLGDQPPFDLVCLSNALLMGLAHRVREALGVKVVCHLQGEHTFIDSLPEPYRSQTWEELARCSRDVDRFIAVSRYHADVMGRSIKPPEGQLHVIHNGVDVTDMTPAPEPDDPPTIGYLARLCRDKGLATLIGAFIELTGRPGMERIRLRIGGTMLGGDEVFVDEQKQRLDAAGLSDQVTWQANLTRQQKVDHLRGLSAFSVPATYGESFGLYVLEALACGVPVVEPRHAAFEEVLGEVGGGLLCEPDDPSDLADQLHGLLTDRAKANDLAQRGRAAVLERFTDLAMAKRVADVLEAAVE